MRLGEFLKNREVVKYLGRGKEGRLRMLFTSINKYLAKEEFLFAGHKVWKLSSGWGEVTPSDRDWETKFLFS